MTFSKSESHQTGWIGLIARILETFARLDSASLLKDSKAMVSKMMRAQVAGE